MNYSDLIPAVMADLDEICALCRGAGARSATSGWDEEYPNRDILSQDLRSGTLRKLMDRGSIAALMQISPWTGHNMDGYEADCRWNEAVRHPCLLGRFCIAPALQGKGLARNILRASLDLAHSMSYDGARFYAVSQDSIALHLYDTVGFLRTGEFDAYGHHFIAYEMGF